MLAMRPDCERCGTDLPADVSGAHICSFECTYCTPCAQALNNICPNCGGDLALRPTRTAARLERRPASTERHYPA